MTRFLAILLLLPACATQTISPTGLKLITEAEYERLISNNSDRVETYKGLYNSLQASATLITTNVGMGQLDQQARLYLWDQAKYNEERLKLQDHLDKETNIFLSFYVPERKHDDLNKPNSIWKIFLDANGKRYEGKAKKMKDQTIEIQGLYPNHNRFSTPYMLSFSIPTKDIEMSKAKLTLTGPAGNATLSF